jgi:tetratricopeptide (TPR) repeat protein
VLSVHVGGGGPRRRRPGVTPALLAGCALALSLAGGRATAAERPTVTLIDLSPEGPAEREIAHDVARALRLDAARRYRDPDEQLNLGAEDADVANIRGARGLLRAGKRLLAARSWAEAAEELEGAVTSYLASFAHAEEEDAIEQCLALHGVALHRAGDQEGAARAFRRAVVFRPAVKIDLAPYGADVAAAMAKAREDVLSRADVRYEVRTSVPNAEVWVNGRYFGLTPAFVKALAGEQYIRISKHGYVRAGRLETVERAEHVAQFELRPARRKPAWDGLRERLGEIFEGAVEPEDLSAAQGLLGANLAVVLRCSGTREKMQVRLALANLSGRQVLKRVTREFSWLRRDKVAVAKLVQELFVAPAAPVGREGPEVRRDSVFKKWWFWALVGGAVAGSVTAAVLLGDTETVGDRYQAGTGGLVLKF